MDDSAAAIRHVSAAFSRNGWRDDGAAALSIAQVSLRGRNRSEIRRAIPSTFLARNGLSADRVADVAIAALSEAASARKRVRRGPPPVLRAILVTDVVGSTAAASELGDRRWRDLLDKHDASIRLALDRFDGSELADSGDGIIATFESATAAVRCAIAIRGDLAGIGLTIRAGVHVGELQLDAGKPGGIAINVAVRVASSAKENEVLVSENTRGDLEGAEFRFFDRGEVQLKGLRGARRLFRVDG